MQGRSEPLLRGHHLICLHFFRGAGYDGKFIENLREVLNRAEERGVIVSSGPDAVCASCLFLQEGECRQSDRAEAGILKMDAQALELLRLSPGDRVSWGLLREKARGLFEAWFSLSCSGCDWLHACETNAFFRELSKRP